jgi:cytochrome P450
MPNTSTSFVGYDPDDPAAQQDPFPHYAALRREAPVYRHPKSGVYFVSRYADVREVLADPVTYSSRFSNAATVPDDPELLAKLGKIAANAKGWLPPLPTMVTADPPVHTRYRKAVAPLIGPRRIRAMEARIRDIAQDLMASWPTSGRVDFKRDFAQRLPVRMIAGLLGVDPADEPNLDKWSDDSVAAIGADIDDDARLDAMQGIVDMMHFWATEIERRRSEPGDDIVSELVQVDLELAGEAPRKLDVPELISIIIQLQVAGKEASTKGFNEVMKMLAERPAVWARMREEPEWIQNVVDEGLRLASPNQGLFRTATADSEVAGVKIPNGATLWVMFGSANRDEERFPDPDRFDPDRANLRDHLAFGIGAHFCIGAPLARAELRVSLEEMTKRVKSVRLAPDLKLVYEPSFILRGLEELVIEIEAG